MVEPPSSSETIAGARSFHALQRVSDQYDREIQAFIAALLDPAKTAAFLAELAS